jgi:hypothetical protein
MAEVPNKPPPSATLSRWRDRLVDTAVLAIPTVLLTQATTWTHGRFFSQPWQILWVALPLLAAAVFAWKLLRRPEAARLNWRLALFLAIYASVFAVASITDLLVWKRMPVAEFAGDTPRNWLLPVTLGDWRYWIVRKAPPDPMLTVILRDEHPGEKPERMRARDAQFIQMAIAQHAKGVFFDVAYPGVSRTDAIFCAAVNSAVHGNIPIVTAFKIEQKPNSNFHVFVPAASAEQTPACLLQSAGGERSRAHAMVLMDVDEKIRTIPLKWDAALDQVPLAVRIAQCMKSKCSDHDLPLPESTLLRFVPTSREPQLIRGDQELAALLSTPEFLSGRFLLVGDLSKKDTFKTPLNAATPGTMIHAYAVNALLAQHYINRPPAWFSAFVVIAACCILAVFESQNAKPQTLLIVAAGLSLAVLALSAAAMAVFLVWVDIIYALVAIWLLVPLLIVYQHIEPKFGAVENAEAGASNDETLNAD